MTSSLSDFLPPPTRSLPRTTASNEGLQKTSDRTNTPRRQRWSSVAKEGSVIRDGPAGSSLVRASSTKKGLAPIVHSSYESLVEKHFKEDELERPSRKEADETTQRTRTALESRVERKIVASKPSQLRGSATRRQSSYVRYTPANTSSLQNSGASQRIIKMMAAPIDPMEPSRFKQKKAPLNPPSPPAPVLHSPTRKVSKEELADWKIPPCVSNWKNNHGYTIPLDKRLAADGRDLQDNRINDRFASLAESLYVAEKTARAEVEARAKVQRKKALKEKEAQEMKLRDLASKARQERTGLLPRLNHSPQRGLVPTSEVTLLDRQPPSLEERAVSARDTRLGLEGSDVRSSYSEEEDDGIRQRNKIREERRRERNRELRKREIHDEDDNAGPTLKRSKLTRDRDRDLSERVALGQGVGAEGARGEVMYDQRLFNQSEGGLGAGFGPGDAYNIYSKPLFNRKSENFQYRGSSGNGLGEKAISKFLPEQSFKGMQETNASRSHGPRAHLVEFEREDGPEISIQRESDDAVRVDKEADPFGLNKFLNAAKRGRSGR
eukprot:Plantae.Rhodophyta-Hildenbrandia_rubra.ctg4950.p1 GENE.Plantae.Rhodophyta-Hildenbrandia_rubra.ctg4950~~Plantae.Rhodophyta-Hildenbrandia_rubra.ctg4950.p1  ORF type:complete len:551 (-),score=82.77 Plantae.Rhodophyta-Hildenbrandia_rubra.ctg4950:695-2347(-)